MDVLQGLMQQLVTALAGTSGWIHSNLAAISTAIVTTLLVIFGDEINGFIKKKIRNYNFSRAREPSSCCAYLVMVYSPPPEPPP